MSVVQTVQRADLLLAVGTATVGTSAVALSAFTWKDRFGNSVNWALSTVITPFVPSVQAWMVSAQGWKASVTSGTGNVFIEHGTATTTAFFVELAGAGTSTGYIAEGRSLISLLQFIASNAGNTVQVEIYG